MDLGPPGRWEKNGRKMGKLAFLTDFLCQFSHFSAIFLPFSQEGHFPSSGLRPEMGSVPGNQDRKCRDRFEHMRRAREDCVKLVRGTVPKGPRTLVRNMCGGVKECTEIMKKDCMGRTKS